jgi:hypothetical protein
VVVGRWLHRWDEHNQRVLEEDNRWLRGDDWVENSAELRRLRLVEAALKHPIQTALLLAIPVGVEIGAIVGSVLGGLVAGVVVFVPPALLYRLSRSWRGHALQEVDRIGTGLDRCRSSTARSPTGAVRVVEVPLGVVTSRADSARVTGERSEELGATHAVQQNRRLRRDGCGARNVAEQGEFAEAAAGAELPIDCSIDGDRQLAPLDEVVTVALVTLTHDVDARAEFDRLGGGE